MYKIHQEDAEDSTNSSFWSDKETEDEVDEIQTGIQTKPNSTGSATQDAKPSDSEVVECFVANDLDDSKNKDDFHNEPLEEELLNDQDQNASESSENCESGDSWEDCGSEEEVNEGGQDKEDILTEEQFKIQNQIKMGKESREILNASDDDVISNLRKMDKSESSSGASSKDRRKKWKDCSDDSSINAETSSEDETNTRSENYSGNCLENDSSGQNSEEDKSTTSNTDSDKDAVGEKMETGEARNDHESSKNAEDFEKKIRKEEMARRTGESKLGSYSESSEITRSDIETCSEFEEENQEMKDYNGKYDYEIKHAAIKMASANSDFAHSSGNDEDNDKMASLSEADVKVTEDSSLNKLTKKSSECRLKSKASKSSQRSSGNDSYSLKSSQDIESEMDTSSGGESESKKMSSESEFMEANLEENGSSEVERCISSEDFRDRKKLRKQDNFYDNSESGEISSHSSNGSCSQDEIAVGKQMRDSMVMAGTDERKMYEVFSEDSSENGESENQPRASVDSSLENEGHKIDSDSEQLDQNKRHFCDEKSEMAIFNSESSNTIEANASNVESDTNNDHFEPSFSNQTSQFASTGNLTEDEKKPNNSQEIGDFEKNDDQVEKDQSEKECQQIGGVDKNTESCDKKATCGNESDQEIQKVSGRYEDKLQAEKLERSNDAIQKALENDNTAIGMRRDGQSPCNIEKSLEGSQDDDEEIERWIEEENLSKKQNEIIQHDFDKETLSESSITSLFTSGYGTIRSEKQDGSHNIEDDRLTINEFDKDSLYSFGVCEQEAGEIHGLPRSYQCGQENEGQILAQDEFWDGRKSENDIERDEDSKVEAQLYVEKVESSEEEEGNGRIKFIDSKLSPSHEKLYQEWEGNLRHPMEGASCLEERLANLHLSTAAQRESENEDLTSHSESQSSESLSEGAFESYTRGMSRSHSDSDIRPKPKSFIRPTLGPTGPKKTDPVAKYFQYKQLWDMFKMPGENDRKALRWEIRERLAYQPPPPKPRKVLVPNTYTAPTEKKRSALRWEIRNDLATGNLPHSYNYRF